MPNSTVLPPIEQWWPHLDIPAKQWMVAHLDDALPQHVLNEICSVCDVEAIADESVTLSPAEKHFIATQIELVD